LSAALSDRIEAIAALGTGVLASTATLELARRQAPLAAPDGSAQGADEQEMATAQA